MSSGELSPPDPVVDEAMFGAVEGAPATWVGLPVAPSVGVGVGVGVGAGVGVGVGLGLGLGLGLGRSAALDQRLQGIQHRVAFFVLGLAGGLLPRILLDNAQSGRVTGRVE